MFNALECPGLRGTGFIALLLALNKQAHQPINPNEHCRACFFFFWKTRI